MLPEASRMNMTLGLTAAPVVDVPSGVVARSIVAAAAVPAEAANVSANTSLRYLRPDGCLMVSPMHPTWFIRARTARRGADGVFGAVMRPVRISSCRDDWYSG